MEKLKSLIENFSVEKLVEFFSEKELNLKKRGKIPSKKNFKEIDNLGEELLKDIRSRLSVYAIKTEGELTERDNKKEQYELAKELLKQSCGTHGIFVFYDDKGNFRFSLVYKIPSLQKTEYSHYSHYRRYSYFVSPNRSYRTFLREMSRADFSSGEKIVAAFSTQSLTKEFYKEIQNWYFWALEVAKNPADKDKHVIFPGGEIKENLIRLLTRLIFVWFLKERKLIPEDIFDTEWLKENVEDFRKKDYYYNVILQNLFFATLNSQPENRKSKFLFGEYLKSGVNTLSEVFKDVPFINGGLFECLDESDSYIDGFSSNENQRTKISDSLFFSDEQEAELKDFYGDKKKVKVRGLINILKDYHFTADESSPVDVEVSLDPELLGHIFENLLATYNPETQETARKATGSYYTPREIVDFMVEESLLEYLKTRTGIPEDKLRKVLSYDENTIPLEENEKKQIVKAAGDLKLLDPAAGSGAFPMGAVHKLVHVLGKVDPENKLWREFQEELIKKQIQENNGDENTEKELRKELEEIFDSNLYHPDYARKFYIIKNSIYGVDIQNTAIQICKLRFFLSLLMDQKVDNRKENLGIKPLPHLETKFVTANTLIDIKGNNGQQYLIPEEAEKKLKTLKLIYTKYFTITTREEKEKLAAEAKKIREEIKELLEKSGWSNENTEKIASFDIFSQTATAGWFNPEWMFGIKSFDIVIGNPPYISTKGVDEKTKKLLVAQYGFADDTYNHFFFKSLELLKDKGILAFITSKTFWTIQTKRNLREHLLENKILKLYDTGQPFHNAMVDTCITIVQKQKPEENHYITVLDGKKDFFNPDTYEVTQETFHNAPNKVFFIPTEINMTIYSKFSEKVKQLLEDWWGKISTSRDIENNKEKLEDYRKKLKPGDITLLGLITEGGQGLATGDNGRFVGVKDGTELANKIRNERYNKLFEAIKKCENIKKSKPELASIKSTDDAKNFMKELDEIQIRNLFDEIKENCGRDIFGRGWIYRIVSENEIADVEKLTDDEKQNGIAGSRTFVPYEKGDKAGNRWYAPTPYYIDWSRKNVKFLKDHSGKKDHGMPVMRNSIFYFREGFCWTDVNSTYLKARVKETGIYDVLSMSLFSTTSIPDWYFVCLINSKFISEYVANFVNSTSHFQINDARQLPIIIPSPEQLDRFKEIFDEAYKIQEQKFSNKISEDEAKKKLDEIQKKLDDLVEKMYLG